MATIIKHSKIPYYQQLYDILRDRIIRGVWQPGDLLPSESELIEQYEVSRVTVRQAFDALVNDGLIYRERGRGTFVTHQTIEQGLSRIISFTEDMRQRSLQPSTQKISAELVPATAEVAKKLQIEPGEELARLERLRLADGEPMSIEVSHLIHAMCPGVLDRDYIQNSLRKTLERTYGLRLVRATQMIRAITASQKLAGPLALPPHGAVLYIERIAFSPENVPVEYLQLYHRGDRYVLHSELKD